MLPRYVLISLLLLLGVLSITLKVSVGDNVQRSHKREIELLAHYMSARGLMPSGAFDLNKEGSFVAHVYRYQNCDGGWLVSPMYRNSEGVNLFERQAVYREYEMGSVFYTLNGEVYEEFPNLEFWLSQKMERIKQVFSSNHENTSPVFSMRNFGFCKETLE